MLDLSQLSLRNRLLTRLDPDDYSLLRPHLEELSVPSGFSLSKPHERIRQIYFPESGLASVTTSIGSDRVEVGVIGREGFVGLPVVLGAASCPHDIFVQMPGSLLRITVEDFRRAAAASPAIREFCLLFVQSFVVQTSFTAMSNARYTVENRLARWILMCHDRTGGDELAVTHEFLAMMLGCRRPGVTVATHWLEGEGMIRATRGRIVVRDREKLKGVAGDSYGQPEAEYERLFGGSGSTSAPVGERGLERDAFPV